MWDKLRSRRALALIAAVVVVAFSLVLASTSPRWRLALGGPFLPGRPPSDVVAGQDPTVGVSGASSSAEPIGKVASAPPSGAQPTAGLPQSGSGAAPGVSDSAASSGSAPTFDIVRVSPNGDSVIAARAAPNTEIALMDGDTVIARAKTDSSGQVAILPPPLKPGEHSLALAIGGTGQGAAISSQSVAVSVPEQAKTAPMVAVLQPNEAAKVLSGPVAGTADPGRPGSSPTAPPSGEAAPPVAIQSVEAEEQGSFFATGKAVPGSQCHVYLNGSFVAAVTADGEGLWSLQINRGMKPGHYAVRVDQIEAKTGKVVARAEVPFDYPVGPVASAAVPEPPRRGAPGGTVAALQTPTVPQPGKSALARVDTKKAPERPQPGAPTGAGQIADASGTNGTTASDATAAAIPTVVNELLTAKVIRGDTLWRISRKMLGHGVRYTQIYAANTLQIRNPRLIFPGQVFVMPQTVTR